METIEQLTQTEMSEIKGGRWIYFEALDEWLWVEDDGEIEDEPCSGGI